VQQSLAEGKGGGLDPVFQVELLENVLEVVFDRVLGDVQGGGDVLVGLPLGNEAKDLFLPR